MIGTIKITTGESSRSYSKGWSQGCGLVKMQLPGPLGHPFILLNEPCPGLHGGLDDQSSTVRLEFSAFVRT